MTRFEALGVLPDKPEILQLQSVSHEGLTLRPMESVLDEIPLNATFKIILTTNKDIPYAVRIIRFSKSGKYEAALIEADKRKVLINKKRFGWQFKGRHLD